MTKRIKITSLTYIFIFTIILIATSVTAAAGHDYLDAQYKTTFFLGAQRCGDTKSWIHDACHTNDGQSVGVDLSGGWHDCGDHIKFAQTNAFAGTSLLHMYNRFPHGYLDRYSQDYSAPPKNGVPDILDEVKILTDYFIKGVKDGRVYYQVGNSSDHNSFSEPAYQSSLGGERKVYSVTQGASNYCGSAAAALALMAMSYEKYDAAYATQCIEKAKEYYIVGAKSPKSIADAEGFAYKYPGPWEDDMAMAAVCLYRATGESFYLTQAENYYNGSYIMPTNSVMAYTNIGPLVAYELYKETQKQKYFNDLSAEYQHMLKYEEDCGYAHFNNWGSLKYTSASSQVAFLYHDLSNDPAAYEFGKMSVDFILGSHYDLGGDAPANFSFIIGYDKLGGGFPGSPHHASAFGKKGNAWAYYSQEKSNPGSVDFKFELTGALVGGPGEACGGYNDNIDDYRTNEVCSYYNAHIVGALAYICLEEGLTSIVKEKNNGAHTSGQQRALTLQQYTVPGAKGKTIAVKVFNIQGKLLGVINSTAGAQLNITKRLSLATGTYVIKTEAWK